MGRWLFALALVCGCGRLDFAEGRVLGDGALSFASDGPHTGDGPNPGVVAYIAPFYAGEPSPASGYAFTAAAAQAGDLILMQVGCSDGHAATAITGANWTFESLGPEAGSPVREIWAETYVALAPDTTPVTLTLANGGGCSVPEVASDEFANVVPGDPIGAVDAHIDLNGNSCSASVVTTRANDVVWAACNSGNTVSGAGAGYTIGSTDGGYAASEFRVTTDPAGTTETATMYDNTVANVMSVVAIISGP